HEKFAQLRVVSQQREELYAGGDAAKEIVEALKREVGVAGAREGGEQLRQQFGEMCPRGGGACGAVPAIVPFAHGGGNFGGIAESHSTQRFDRPRIIVAAREDEIAAIGPERLAFGEQVGVIALHTIERGAILRLE